MAKVTTNRNGTFRMPLFELPIWEPYPVGHDDDGSTVTAEAVFADDVVIYAYRGEGSTEHTRLPLALDDRRESRYVQLRLPD